MIIKAVPLWRPLNGLAYVSPFEVHVGDLIKIPLGTRSVPGCVTSLGGDEPEGVKEIESVIEPRVFPESLIDLCSHLARRHAAFMGQTLGLALPREIMRPPRKRAEPIPGQQLRNLKPRSDEEKLFASIVRTTKPVLINSSADYTGLVVKLVKEIMDKGRQILLLLPHEPALSRFWERFRPYLPLELYHAALSQTEKRRTWHRVNKGEIEIVTGLRSAALLPFRELGLILVFEEDCDSHRVRSHHVHYDARELALYRGIREKATVVLFSPAPRLETMHKAQSGGMLLVERRGGQQGKAMIVDLKNQSPDRVLSKSLVSEITRTYERGMQSVLLLNRLGTAARMVCVDCGNVLTCQKCGFPYKFVSAGKSLSCPICGMELPAPDRCPQCDGSNWQSLSPGLTALGGELRELFKDSSICKVTGEERPVVEEVENSMVIYGTGALLEYLPPRVQTAAALSWDAERSRPHFRSTERAFRDLIYLRRMLTSTPESRLIVQTFRPKDQVISWALKADYRRFFESEVRRRQELGYPPYNTLVLLQRTSSPRAWKAERMMETVHRDGIQIMGPYSGPHQRETLLVKLRRDREPDSLLDAAALKRSGWQAEVDPTEIT